VSFSGIRVAVATVAVAVLMVSCGSADQTVRATDTQNVPIEADVQRTVSTEGAVPSERTLPAVSIALGERFEGPFDSSPESLGRCTRAESSVVDILDPLGGFAVGDVWHNVVAVEGDISGLDPTINNVLGARGLSIQFETLDGKPATPQLNGGIELQFFGQKLEAIRSELLAGNRVEVRVHATTGGVGALSVRSDGQVVAIGNCRNRVTAEFERAANILSTEHETLTGVDVLQMMREIGGDAVTSMVSAITNPDLPPWAEQDPMERSLDRELAPAGLVDSLIPIYVAVTLPPSWIEARGGLCTRQAIAWQSPCYDLEYADGAGQFIMEMFVVAGETIELWLMDDGSFDTARGPAWLIEASEVIPDGQFDLDLGAIFSVDFATAFESLS